MIFIFIFIYIYIYKDKDKDHTVTVPTINLFTVHLTLSNTMEQREISWMDRRPGQRNQRSAERHQTHQDVCLGGILREEDQR